MKEQIYPGHSWSYLLPSSAFMQLVALNQSHISAAHQSIALELLNTAQTSLAQLIFLPITTVQNKDQLLCKRKNIILRLKFKSLNNY